MATIAILRNEESVGDNNEFLGEKINKLQEQAQTWAFGEGEGKGESPSQLATALGRLSESSSLALLIIFSLGQEIFLSSQKTD